MTFQTLVTRYYGLKPVQTPTALPVQIPTGAEVFWLLRSLVCWSRQKIDFLEKKTALTALFCIISTVPTSTMSSSPLIRSAAPETTVTVKTTTTSPTSDLTTAVISQSKAVTVTTNTITPMMTMTISLPTRRQTTMTSIQQLTKVSHTEKPGKTLLYHTHTHTHTHTGIWHFLPFILLKRQRRHSGARAGLMLLLSWQWFDLNGVRLEPLIVSIATVHYFPWRLFWFGWVRKVKSTLKINIYKLTSVSSSQHKEDAAYARERVRYES